MMNQKGIDCGTNDPDKYQRECIENSVEDMHSDIGVYRRDDVLVYSTHCPLLTALNFKLAIRIFR